MSNEPPKDDITIEEFLKHLEQLVTGKPEGSSDESKASNSSGSSANLKDLLAEFRLKDKEFVDLLNKKLKDYEEIRPALNALADEFSKIITSSLGSDAEEPKVEAEKSDTLVMVGGAVLNETFAKKIGADFYGKDAKAGADIAKKVFGE